jgi:hypothetical protein
MGWQQVEADKVAERPPPAKRGGRTEPYPNPRVVEGSGHQGLKKAHALGRDIHQLKQQRGSKKVRLEQMPHRSTKRPIENHTWSQRCPGMAQPLATWER